MVAAREEQPTKCYKVEFPTLKHTEIRIIAEIGRGTYGKVFRGFSNAVGNVAIKVCHSDLDEKKLQEEVMATVRYGAAHPNIVKVFGFYDDPKYGISFALEYMSGGSLHKVLLERCDLVYYVDHIVSWMYQISSAVAHMHKCNVVHRDLKPDNILMNELFTIVKICDLGEARVLVANEDYTSKVGSYLFMAPEVMNSHSYTNRVDVFSMGMIFWMMFSRRLPNFIKQFKHPGSFMQAVIKGTRPALLPVLEVFNDIIQTCMAGNAEDRVNAEVVRDFAVDLLQRFPHGQEFLVHMPESTTLYEPINIRGDVNQGQVDLEVSFEATVAPNEWDRKKKQRNEEKAVIVQQNTTVAKEIYETAKEQGLTDIVEVIKEPLVQFNSEVQMISNDSVEEEESDFISTLMSTQRTTRSNRGASNALAQVEVQEEEQIPQIEEVCDLRAVNEPTQQSFRSQSKRMERPQELTPKPATRAGGPVSGPDFRNDSSPISVTKTLASWYINSTKIDQNMVKNRRKMFEPTVEE